MVGEGAGEVKEGEGGEVGWLVGGMVGMGDGRRRDVVAICCRLPIIGPRVVLYVYSHTRGGKAVATYRRRCAWRA